jgi:hypothetical protein
MTGLFLIRPTRPIQFQTELVQIFVGRLRPGFENRLNYRRLKVNGQPSLRLVQNADQPWRTIILPPKA